MNELQEIAARVRPLRTIWVALIIGMLVYTGVLLFLIRIGAVAPVQALRTGPGLYFAILLLLVLVGTQFVRRRVEKTPSFATRSEVASRWQTGWLVGQTIKEGVGLGGGVLGLLVGSSVWIMAFGVASALSMIMSPPWESELHKRLQNARPDPE